MSIKHRLTRAQMARLRSARLSANRLADLGPEQTDQQILERLKKRLSSGETVEGYADSETLAAHIAVIEERISQQ